MRQVTEMDLAIWKLSVGAWIAFIISMLLVTIIFYDGIVKMVTAWAGKEEYGYAFFIPLLSIFFVWQKKDVLEKLEFHRSWVGVLVVALGLFGYFLGEFSTLYIIIQYSLLVVIYGLILAFIGWPAFRIILAPLVMLAFVIPLPVFLYQNLSANLQLISSELGVFFIRLFDISVYLEGNVIDLGNYKLQVVEACSGLRYLFPLACLAFIAAYIFKADFWKRMVVFLSCIPITIFMNSLRIGIIGVLVDRWGTSQAEGFLHFFEGWVIFMGCMAILILEIWFLNSIGSNRTSLAKAFSMDIPGPAPTSTSVRKRRISSTAIIAAVLLLITLPLAAAIEKRQEIIPEREEFSEFPLIVNDWNGKAESLEQIYLDALKLDDYIIVYYENAAGSQVNFYVAYYASQSKGESAHSPRSCIPGGGWKIEDLSQRELDGVTTGGVPLKVNRLIIGKGDFRQLVYYWFQGRGRNICSEYAVKWFLFWDALTRNRTDGALVRLTAYIGPNGDVQKADRLLTSFARDISPVLDAYIPK